MVLVDGESTAMGYVTFTVLLPLLSHFSTGFSSGTFMCDVTLGHRFTVNEYDHTIASWKQRHCFWVLVKAGLHVTSAFAFDLCRHVLYTTVGADSIVFSVDYFTQIHWLVVLLSFIVHCSRHSTLNIDLVQCIWIHYTVEGHAPVKLWKNTLTLACIDDIKECFNPQIKVVFVVDIDNEFQNFS